MFKYKQKSFLIGLLSLLVFLPSIVFSQNNSEILSKKLQSFLLTEKSQQNVAAFIYFKDKGDNINAKLLAAEKALSPKAVQQRVLNRGAENIVDVSDIPINPDYLNVIKAKVSKIRHQLKMLNAVSVEATPSNLAQIAKLAFIKKITLVKKIKRIPEPKITPQQINEAQNSLQPEVTTALDYGTSLTQNNQINVPAVHELGYNGSGVVIAVFDSGFNRLSHETFSQMNIVDTWDFVNGDADVGDGGMGVGDHGTNTLSTLGGYSPGNLIGPAYGATYYLAKTENTESELHVEEDNWCAAAEWADSKGAQIISSSLGYADFDSGGDYSASDMDGDTATITICADLAAEKGIVVINSAGNEGYNASQNTLGAPADGHFVIAVGAVTSSGSRSSFSSVGLSADGRIKPDVMAMGSSVRVASPQSNTRYTYSNGTSFSCPLTAGVAALVLQSNPNLTAAQLRDILRNTADNASGPNRLKGYGIVNALAAVEAAATSSISASFNHSANALTVNFTDTSTTPSGATITQWAWDFGDGNTASSQNPTHTYASPNTYNVSLSITDSKGRTDSITNSVTVENLPPVEYCASKANNNNYEWIDRVDVGTFSNSSGASGYSDFTAMMINMTAGQSYPVTLSPGFRNSSYSESWKVWIDFNKDGDFNDSGETVFSGRSRADFSGSIAIPSSTTAGSTRMRVSMQYNTAPSSCGSFTYGEVEDYTVIISNP